MEVLGYRKTHPTACRECGSQVFFHTNGNGDAVFFDRLGPPWPVHGCYSGRVKGRPPRSFDEYRAYMVGIYGGTPKRRSRIGFASPPVSQRKSKPMSQPPKMETFDIARCEPGNFLGRTLEISGFVHDIHAGRPISKLAPEGTIGFAQYRRVIGADIFTQVTVIDSELMSYTIAVPVAKLDLRQGDIVSGAIGAIETLDGPIFICRRLDRIQLGDA